MGRRLGQHFLSSKSILDRIAHAACDDRAPLVIEIGPGKGALTESLLECADRVIAIELDTLLVHYLRQKFQDAIAAGRLEVVEGDVLKVDLSKWGRAAIAGNLPYYITSPILEKIFELGSAWTRAVFLVQKEVAERIAASPGSRDFGFLSVETQVNARPEILFDVPRGAFRPPPKVDSAVVRLDPVEFEMADRAGFLKFASACFRYKRKTLRNNLAGLYEGVDGLSQRAEQMSVGELIELYKKLAANERE